MSFSGDSQFNINLEQQRKRAKELRRSHREGSIEAAVRILRYLPRARDLSPEHVLASPFTLSEAQLVVAREAGFSSWPNLKRYVEGAGADGSEAVIEAALAGNDSGVASLVERDPGAVGRSIHAAAAVADRDAAFALLAADPSLADRPGGRRGWRPLLYVCSSRYGRDASDAARVEIARRLLELGAAVSARAAVSATHGMGDRNASRAPAGCHRMFPSPCSSLSTWRGFCGGGRSLPVIWFTG